MRYCAIQSNGSFSTREGRVRDDHFLTIACEVQKPKIDEKLKLLTDFGETEAICTEVRDDPARSEGVLLKVMAAAHSRPDSSAGSSIATARKSARLSRTFSRKP